MYVTVSSHCWSVHLMRNKVLRCKMEGKVLHFCEQQRILRPIVMAGAREREKRPRQQLALAVHVMASYSGL